MPDFIEQLVTELDSAPSWPLPREKRAVEQALRGRALRRCDTEELRRLQAWDPDRTMVVDPLGRRIAYGFADFLYAEPITLDTDDEAAQAEVDNFREANRLDARLHRAERVIVSEGEAWWKLHTEPALADTPLVSWCSRRDVVPLLYGDRVVACAFVTEKMRDQETIDEKVVEKVWRHVEVHGPGRVLNLLYLGTGDALGTRIPLESLPHTAGLNEDWQHGLPMLAGRIVNDLDDEDTQGVSEYEPVEDLLFALNEAVTIAVENARLTGKDRIFVAGRFTQADGSFDASLEVFQVEQEGGTLGEGKGSPPIYGIEKKYDAEPLWRHIAGLVKTTLSRVGMVVQIVDSSEEGAAESGTAIRLRFLPTALAAKGKAKEHEETVPHIVSLALQIIAKPTGEGGFGRTVATDPPAIEFGNPIPVDESEETKDRALAVTAQIMSRRQAITESHPDWTPEQVDEELRLIREDEGAHVDPVAPPHDPMQPDPHA